MTRKTGVVSFIIAGTVAVAAAKLLWNSPKVLFDHYVSIDKLTFK